MHITLTFTVSPSPTFDLNSPTDAHNHNNVLGHQQENIVNSSDLLHPGCFGGVFKGFTVEVIPLQPFNTPSACMLCVCVCLCWSAAPV